MVFKRVLFKHLDWCSNVFKRLFKRQRMGVKRLTSNTHRATQSGRPLGCHLAELRLPSLALWSPLKPWSPPEPLLPHPSEVQSAQLAKRPTPQPQIPRSPLHQLLLRAQGQPYEWCPSAHLQWERRLFQWERPV